MNTSTAQGDGTSGSAAHPVVVVGAGLAGLACATHIQKAGVACRVLEASDRVGGRVATDEVEGFRLDRGFQVLLSAYPEAQRMLDYAALDLRSFQPGALIHVSGQFHRISDPWRRPGHLLDTLRAPVGTVVDKARIGLLRARLSRTPLKELFGEPQQATTAELARLHLSESMIERFMRPFLGGIFLERELTTSSRMFAFVFKMFGEGNACVPAWGMARMPDQLAAALDPGTVALNTPVVALEEGSVRSADGASWPAASIVVATDGARAASLLGGPPPPAMRSVHCLYFNAPRSPMNEAVLMLDGEGRGPVNNVAVMSEVSPELAPEGRALVSTTVLDTDATDQDEAKLEQSVRRHMTEWFGAAVAEWRLLRCYRIEGALPHQDTIDPRACASRVRHGSGRYVCGDHLHSGSIEGALRAGRLAAEAVLDDLGNGVGHGA